MTADNGPSLIGHPDTLQMLDQTRRCPAILLLAPIPSLWGFVRTLGVFAVTSRDKPPVRFGVSPKLTGHRVKTLRSI
jgi:hypothetical protein